MNWIIYFIDRFAPHPILSGIGNHPDDGRSSLPVVEADAFSQRIVVFESMVRQRLVDDGNHRRTAVIALLEIATGEHRHDKGGEIVWADDPKIGLRIQLLIGNRLPFDNKIIKERAPVGAYQGIERKVV